jgi:hypothetical protein
MISDGSWSSGLSKIARAKSKNPPCAAAASDASAAASALGWICSSGAWRQPVPEFLAHLQDGARRPQAEAALEVAVFDDRVGRVRVSEYMVTRWVDRARQCLTEIVVRTRGIRDPEDDRREREGDDGRREHTHSRFVLRERVVDREVDDEQRDGESDRGQRGTAEDAIEGKSRSELAEPQTPEERTRSEHAEELADDQAHDDAPCQGGAGRVGEDLGAQHDARVGKGEQRKDDVRDVRGVGGLEPLVDRDGFAQAVRGGAGVLGVGRLAEGACEFERVLDVVAVGAVHGDE